MQCQTCNHKNKKEPAKVHKAGKCEQCNCGSSELIFSTPHIYNNFDYHNNYYAWAERFSHLVRPETRTRSGGGF